MVLATVVSASYVSIRSSAIFFYSYYVFITLRSTTRILHTKCFTLILFQWFYTFTLTLFFYSVFNVSYILKHQICTYNQMEYVLLMILIH